MTMWVTKVVAAWTSSLLLLLLPASCSAFATPSSSSKKATTAFVSNKNKSLLYGTAPKSWSIADDWSSLSSENAVPDSDSIFNQDLALNAAAKLQQDCDAPQLSEEERRFMDVIDEIQNPLILDPSDPPLYDTQLHEDIEKNKKKKNDDFVQTKTFQDELGREISLLVRCNEQPEQMLIEGGRALPPLTDEEKYDVEQLVTKTLQATPFFQQAVSQIFLEHASKNDNDDDEPVMTPVDIARWMTKALGSNVGPIGQHDRRVLAVIGKFGEYKSGRLLEEDFQRLYLSAVTDAVKGAKRQHRRSSQPTIMSIWRDLRNHGILAPAEQERARLAEDLRAQNAPTHDELHFFNYDYDDDTLMDECEIVEWDNGGFDLSTTNSASSSGSSVRGKSGKKSSHELVTLAYDKQTPLYLRDGDFVFIDEESCIGCMQCALVCPSSFVMLESGRARTFVQRNSHDVQQAVDACPVDCMHRVSFRELQEFEQARDNGDGRTDHRHLGHRRGHTPLSVAGIDSDANHRSSWYHYLKNKCHMSGQCPSRGCYDCPHYSKPGANPYFQAREKKAQHHRAKHFMESGAADRWRKTAEL